MAKQRDQRRISRLLSIQPFLDPTSDLTKTEESGQGL
jgi:hypothetical protein